MTLSIHCEIGNDMATAQYTYNLRNELRNTMLIGLYIMDDPTALLPTNIFVSLMIPANHTRVKLLRSAKDITKMYRAECFCRT